MCGFISNHPTKLFRIEKNWDEFHGKTCDSEGVHCIKTPTSYASCGNACLWNEKCKAFQEPIDGDTNGWCVWFDYEVHPNRNNMPEYHYGHTVLTLGELKVTTVDTGKGGVVEAVNQYALIDYFSTHHLDNIFMQFAGND